MNIENPKEVGEVFSRPFRNSAIQSLPDPIYFIVAVVYLIFVIPLLAIMATKSFRKVYSYYQ